MEKLLKNELKLQSINQSKISPKGTMFNQLVNILGLENIGATLPSLQEGISCAFPDVDENVLFLPQCFQPFLIIKFIYKKNLYFCPIVFNAEFFAKMSCGQFLFVILIVRK